MPQVIGDAIDRLCAVEIRFRPQGESLPRGVNTPLYEAARREAGAPLSYVAATGLVERVRPNDRVFVICGSGTPPFLPFGETDGPLGGAIVARALDLGLGAKPVIISEPHMMGANRATVAAAGLAIHDEGIFAVRPHSALTVEFPYGMERRAEVEALFDQHRPSAVFFVERTGPNAKGVYHTIRGTAKKPDEIIAGHLFAEVARERGIFSIGVGDGGNEIGFGRIYAAAREIQPAGKRCICPCGDGVITAVPTDVLVMAGTSNWGGYGIAAMLGYLLEKPDLVQEPDMEYRMLAACVAAGGADGAYASPVMKVDGTSWQTQQAIVTMLREIVVNGLTPLSRGF
jgi:hypothetical protein